MRLTLSIGFALGVAVSVVMPAQATEQSRHIATAPTVATHRVCDWVGPGARAIYRCTVVETTAQPMVVSQAPQRTCDWVGPGARAIYRCHY